MDIVKGYEIPFHSKPFQSKIPFPINSELRRETAIQKIQLSKGEFVSNLFLVRKKDGGQRPVINLKQLNAYIPYCHFKIEGLQNLKYVLQKEDYMCKLDLKDAYFSVPLEKRSRQFVRFHWSGNLHELLCLCFGFGPARPIFTKLIKVSVTILCRITPK